MSKTEPFLEKDCYKTKLPVWGVYSVTLDD